MSGFEGSFLGAKDRISPQAIMECKICWTPYDPAQGDDFRQVEPGTPFTDLPHDWSCPTCSGDKSQFMVLSDAGADALREAARVKAVTDRLVADFTEVFHGKMRDVPIVNKALKVQAVGFRAHQGNLLGVLVSQWFMNLILLPDGDDWSDLIAGEKEVIDFPSGAYEFIQNTREQIGGYKACSLFSPMGQFKDQASAVEVAEAVMRALFDPAHRAGTDRATDIRAAREAELAPPPEAPAAPTRRAVVTGALSQAHPGVGADGCWTQATLP
ncbi:[NiFe]-hydrogenase assembly chaperone HybE [Jannaschia seohaensis]|uniref:[NiFe] hydrogenase assembly HybE family chaperone n=1 Tax=Jannaschia seohaensis TaxID=475081 RepID=A0A2Y9A152_9RHOB|nr:[NiFe]-hydrogenase assembly chaperone HybE [Jannaschia seohaensis]PWJ21846.1 [NiFe] hydrogenase assembly HybE family chaperone [Jannaschia seohaensis]SSA38124.1 [NiFe] hydrogenase assembly chaperone, HybE family [Jannaschia seohaensis]